MPPSLSPISAMPLYICRYDSQVCCLFWVTAHTLFSEIHPEVLEALNEPPGRLRSCAGKSTNSLATYLPRHSGRELNRDGIALRVGPLDRHRATTPAASSTRATHGLP